MDVKKFSGVYPAVITPFTTEGEVDVEKLTHYIDYLAKNVDGLFVGGSYGSGPIMTVEQRKTLAEITVKTAAGRVPVILHIGTTNLNDTIELAKHAESVGADAIAAVTPYYYRRGLYVLYPPHRLLPLERKGNPDGSFSNDPSLRTLKASAFLDRMSPGSFGKDPGLS